MSAGGFLAQDTLQCGDEVLPRQAARCEGRPGAHAQGAGPLQAVVGGAACGSAAGDSAARWAARYTGVSGAGRFAAVCGGNRRVVKDGVRYLPLPHPSGVSRWLNERENVEAVARGMAIMREWVVELGI